ncbi:FAD-dependent oxidoreductase [Saccharothrix violaceirubra]|uniref:ferredoxin--NADP(+) reductase n=1 Tax=Saccharothrix violaceirubra TaxID=413306 RepID=A0A7W7SYQ8_9PSEU|nr:FAD-dependent oxidoreductase [Saccharothrix violaceirubra]MBB4963396.1 ferredoxin--NADP+ reductase [Saccharothrix violaceirubra]
MRFAVVGAGPAGVYSAQELLAGAPDCAVDVFDRLPAPYGLVRYGVAPDHPRTKRISTVLGRTLGDPAVRFFGNVTFGLDIGLRDLLACYHAVVFAVGADDEPRLGIPGEDLPGVGSAGRLVSWYNAHPHADDAFPRRVLAARDVAVVGAGNVALDVARVLVGGPDRLASGDVPEDVLKSLADGNVTDVRVIARRGPAHARFTLPELTELGRLDDVDVVVDPADLSDGDQVRGRGRSVWELLREWSSRPLSGAPRRVHLLFHRRPVEVVGSRLGVERAGVRSDLPAGAVVRAIGYRGRPLPGVPHDEVTGTIRNRGGRVVDATGVVVPRLYAAGWIKRGPGGVIGTNRADAAATVRAVLADAAGFPVPFQVGASTVPVLLHKRNVRYVTWAGWLRLDAHEIDLGRVHGRPRVSVGDLATMLSVARAGQS